MKVKIFLLSLFFSITAFSQAVIEMNPSSCFGDSGLIEINSGTFYDGYQWYSRPLGSSAQFLPILGATNDSFSFDWSAFDLTEIKLWAIYNTPGFSYFSNEIEVNRSNCNLGINNETLNSAKKIIIFPNPVEKILTISSKNTIDNVDIINSLNQVVLSQKSNSTNPQIDISILQSGIYILSVRYGSEFTNVKFVKSR